MNALVGVHMLERAGDNGVKDPQLKVDDAFILGAEAGLAVAVELCEGPLHDVPHGVVVGLIQELVEDLHVGWRRLHFSQIQKILIFDSHTSKEFLASEKLSQRVLKRF